jgi:hypothetical protein
MCWDGEEQSGIINGGGIIQGKAMGTQVQVLGSRLIVAMQKRLQRQVQV